MPSQAGKEGSSGTLLQPCVNEVLSSYPLRIISDSGLKDHLRTFARHPGIALGFSHKIHHPNAFLFLTVQYNPPFLSNVRDWVDWEKMLILLKHFTKGLPRYRDSLSPGKGKRKGPIHHSVLIKHLFVGLWEQRAVIAPGSAA